MNLMLNFWAPRSDAHIPDFNQDWSKGMDDSKMPFEASFAYIEVYSYDVDTKTFNFSWSDNFDGGLDETLWTAADGVGWDTNLSTFEKSQVEAKDHKLTLTMTKNPQSMRDTYESVSPAFIPLGSFLN